jgi:hypothetical protein
MDDVILIVVEPVVTFTYPEPAEADTLIPGYICGVVPFNVWLGDNAKFCIVRALALLIEVESIRTILPSKKTSSFIVGIWLEVPHVATLYGSEEVTQVDGEFQFKFVPDNL